MRSERHEGFTLAELLVVVAIIGIFAAVAIPLLSSQDSKKLDAAAEEVGNALRFAVNEARRTESYILVDAKMAPGRLRVVASDIDGNDLGPVNDPLTKQALDIDIGGGVFTGPVIMKPMFMQGGTDYKQLLIGPKCCTAGQLQASDEAFVIGTLESGSGIVLSLGSLSGTVSIDETTGFVAIPAIP